MSNSLIYNVYYSTESRAKSSIQVQLIYLSRITEGVNKIQWISSELADKLIHKSIVEMFTHIIYSDLAMNSTHCCKWSLFNDSDDLLLTKM